jgi:hypothetical protein
MKIYQVTTNIDNTGNFLKVHLGIGRFLIVGSRDQVTCTLLPSCQWDLSPLLDHMTQSSGCELRIT